MLQRHRLKPVVRRAPALHELRPAAHAGRHTQQRCLAGRRSAAIVEAAALGAGGMQQSRGEGGRHREHQAGIAGARLGDVFTPGIERALALEGVRAWRIALENHLLLGRADAAIRQDEHAAFVPAGAVRHAGALFRVRPLQIIDQVRLALVRRDEALVEQQRQRFRALALEEGMRNNDAVPLPIPIIEGQQQAPAAIRVIAHQGDDFQRRRDPARRLLGLMQPQAALVQLKAPAGLRLRGRRIRPRRLQFPAAARLSGGG